MRQADLSGSFPGGGVFPAAATRWTSADPHSRAHKCPFFFVTQFPENLNPTLRPFGQHIHLREDSRHTAK